MNVLNTDFSTSETTSAPDFHRSHNFTSRRDVEFQSALENYLSDYRRKFHADMNRAGIDQTSVLQWSLKWVHLQWQSITWVRLILTTIVGSGTAVSVDLSNRNNCDPLES